MAWITTKTGKRINTDWFDKDRQIAENKKQADERNFKFGKPGTYKVYRSGDIFDSPLGFLSFGMDKKQSVEYEKRSGKPIEEYTLQIKKPLYITGTDIDKMQDDLCKKYVGKSLLEETTIEGAKKIMKQTAQKIYEEGYDSILMEKKNKLSGQSTYEIGVLNQMKDTVIRKSN